MKMLKNIGGVCAVLFIFAILCGCSETPKDVVEKMNKALSEKKWDEAMSFIEDKNNLKDLASLKESPSEVQNETALLFKLYKAGNEMITDDTATVEIYHPNKGKYLVNLKKINGKWKVVSVKSAK